MIDDTPNKVQQQLHSLEPSAVIELFQLRLTEAKNGGNLNLFYHAGTNEVRENIVFAGITYQPVPIEVDGFAASTKGTLPRPTMKIANANNVISGYLLTYNLLGAEVRRIRTLKKYLDAVNFVGGSNDLADPDAIFGGTHETWYIDRIANENIELVEFELVGKLDLSNINLPGRKVVEHCPWVYKSFQCGYKPGKRFNLKNVQVNNDEEDQCAKNLRACELRFPRGKGIGARKNLLPFGGFPGARLQT